MKKIIAMLLCIVTLVCIAGCTSTPMALNNVTWDMTKEEVKAAEGEDNIVDGASETVLNWMLTDELSNVFGERTVSVGYVFSQENKLTGITVQIFANEDESIEAAMNATRTAMDKVYGESFGDDAAAHWHDEISAIALQKVEGTESFFVAIYSPISAHSH